MIIVATIQDEEQPSRLHQLQGVVIQAAALLIAAVVLGLTLTGQINGGGHNRMTTV